MVFVERQEPFVCEHCEAAVEPLTHGSCRNHCPKCLYSKHVDLDGPGDRAATCLALMAPTAIDQKHGEWIIVHTCTKCRKTIRNKAAPDDDVLAAIKAINAART